MTDTHSHAALRWASELLMQVNARVMGVVLNAFNPRSANGCYYCNGSKYASRYYQQAEEEAKQGAQPFSCLAFPFSDTPITAQTNAYFW